MPLRQSCGLPPPHRKSMGRIEVTFPFMSSPMTCIGEVASRSDDGGANSNIQLPVPAERVTVHDFDAFGDQVVADGVGFGKFLGYAGFLAGC